MYIADGLLKHAEKDYYENGCDPNSSISNLIDINFSGNSIDELIHEISDFLSCDDYMINPCEQEPNRIDWQLLENADGYRASQRDVELWEKGSIDLWLVDYSAIVEYTIKNQVDIAKALQSE